MNIKDWRTTLEIFENHSKNKDNGWPIDAAEHDVIYSSYNTKDIPEDSDDGKVLNELGWCVDHDLDGNWVLYV